MTKQNYVAIAKIINDETQLINGERWIDKELLVNELCNYFEKDNILFKRDTFIKACK